MKINCTLLFQLLNIGIAYYTLRVLFFDKVIELVEKMKSREEKRRAEYSFYSADLVGISRKIKEWKHSFRKKMSETFFIHVSTPVLVEIPALSPCKELISEQVVLEKMKEKLIEKVYSSLPLS